MTKNFAFTGGKFCIVPTEEYEKVALILEKAMLTLDDYLNAGNKDARAEISEDAKILYKKYYGVDYVNRNEREW